MARHEENREDLIAEASALVDRIELRIEPASASDEAIITAGFRRNGFLSLYFGQDRFYQFDLEGRLRRAYVAPFVYRAQFGSLCRLERQRSREQTTLARTDLSPSESTEFIQECFRFLTSLLSEMERDDCQILRFVLADDGTSRHGLLEKVRTSLHRVLQHEDGFFSHTIAKQRMKPG